MASPQFLHLLEQIHKTAKTKKLAWRPARVWYSTEGSFRVALGEGIIRIEAESEDEWQFKSCYRASLYTRDGQIVDGVRAAQCESEFFPVLRDIYQSARTAAFNLDQMIDGMQDDIESGRARDLPPEEEPSSDIPF